MDLSGKSGQSLNPRAAAPSNGLPGQTTMLNSGFEYHNEAVSNPSAVIFTFFNDVVVFFILRHVPFKKKLVAL